MAKGKHSVALFEVIQQTRSSSRASSLRTPKWWFKSKKTDPAPPAPVEPVIDSGAPAPRHPGVDLKLDPDRQRIKFEVSYTSAGVAAFTVIVVVGLAYIIGSHMTRGPAPAMAGASTDQVLRGPTQPGVMKIGTDKPIIPPINANPKTDRVETITTPPTPVTPPAPAPPAPRGAKPRDAGLNYTVILSFPNRAKDMAFELADFLNANGLACTVETNVSGYPNLFVVVGLEGFVGVSGDDYKKYESTLRQLNTRLGNDKTIKNAKFLRFDNPAPRKWQGQERTATRG